MAIKNTVSNDFGSTFVDNLNLFDCRLSSVFIKYTYSTIETVTMSELRCSDEICL